MPLSHIPKQKIFYFGEPVIQKLNTEQISSVFSFVIIYLVESIVAEVTELHIIYENLPLLINTETGFFADLYSIFILEMTW